MPVKQSLLRGVSLSNQMHVAFHRVEGLAYLQPRESLLYHVSEIVLNIILAVTNKK